MTYASQADLVERYGEAELVQLTDRADPPDGEIDATAVARALADTDATIDAYVRRRYALPLPSTPPALVPVACAIARYMLHEDFPDERVKQAYDAAMAFLKDLSTGRAVLDIEGAEPPPAAAGVQVAGPARIFSRDSLKDF